MEEKKDFLPEVTKEVILNVAKAVKKYYQEVTITKVSGVCPYGHKEGERHRITSTVHDGLCGALWQANHSSIASLHYGGSVCLDKEEHHFKGVCPEMGKVEIEVRAAQRKDAPPLNRKANFIDMTGKGFSGVDRYRVYMEIIGIAHNCMYGLKPGQKFEVDPFNISEACGYLYWGAYGFINLLLTGGCAPWEPEENIIHGICPDLYNQVSYLLIREER